MPTSSTDSQPRSNDRRLAKVEGDVKVLKQSVDGVVTSNRELGGKVDRLADRVAEQTTAVGVLSSEVRGKDILCRERAKQIDGNTKSSEHAHKRLDNHLDEERSELRTEKSEERTSKGSAMSLVLQTASILVALLSLLGVVLIYLANRADEAHHAATTHHESHP